MKKTMQSLLILLPLVLFSCFEFVGTGSTRQLLQVALAAPGDVAKIHVAVFDGGLTQDRVIYNKTFSPGSSIPLDLPAGDNRFIVVWGESFSGMGNYFGAIGPVSIQDSDNMPLPVQMQKFHTDALTDAFNVSGNSPLTWSNIPGAFTYELDFERGNVQVSAVNSAQPANCCTVTVRVLTSVFNIPSEPSNPYNFG